MTPTPAETALWRALNVEPEYSSTGFRWPIWRDWKNARKAFEKDHPADRLAYFEGKVREKGGTLAICESDDEWRIYWDHDDHGEIAQEAAPTEHLARFHAAARAIHALGMITDAQMKEIEDVG